MFGAVECQKVSGALHFHFWVYVQRLHQMKTLKEIATLLPAKLCNVETFKQFIGNLCREDYPDLASFTQQIHAVEQCWPTYNETDEKWLRSTVSALPQPDTSTSTLRLGRIPDFVRADSGSTYEDCLQARAEESDNGPSYEKVLAEGLHFKEQLDTSWQFLAMRCQHHFRKWNATRTKRVIPNGCLCKGRPNECKHGAPWIQRLNTDKPLLLCKKLAKAKGLSCRGVRNVVGTLLGTRNEEWVNGTAPGLCIAFGGCNTDVSPGDRLPILAETHEDKCCRGKCVERISVRRIVRLTQRSQAARNGYCGGYLSKRQPNGKMETKKCIDKMHKLRQDFSGRSDAKRYRMVTGRMATDLEMNGVIRGAVEEFNLARNMNKQDVLFAECVRTFASRDVDARAWLNRLEVELRHTYDGAQSQGVPYTVTPKRRTKRSKAPLMDAYGFRPLIPAVTLLSAYEFYMHWRCEPLLPPFEYRYESEQRTVWTPAGEALYAKSCRYRNEVQFVPGTHFTVVQNPPAEAARK